MSDARADALTKWFSLSEKQRERVLNNTRVDYESIVRYSTIVRVREAATTLGFAVDC